MDKHALTRCIQEDGFDVLFNGILAILVMTILGLNPWPLLVSFSTVMVSFAFSFGPSCAKYIEVSGTYGLLLASLCFAALEVQLNPNFTTTGNVDDSCQKAV